MMTASAQRLDWAVLDREGDRGSSAANLWRRLFCTSHLAASAAGAEPRLQQRVRLFIQVMLGLSGLIFIGAALTWAWLQADWSNLPVRSAWADGKALGTTIVATSTLFLAGGWWYLRRSLRSHVELHLVESVGTVLYCAVLSALPRALPEEAPQSGPTLLLVLVLVARAGIVPSRASVTLLVGLLGTAALTLSTYLDGRSVDPTVNPLGPYLWWVPLAWGVTFAVVTALISRLIYGLHQSVHDALQLGNYRLVEKLGEGGMGVVYLGRHALLRRPTAVKLLPPEKAGEDAVARFEQEVQQTARLSHPNVVAIYDYGRTPDNIFYYAMEYLDGLNLERLVAMAGPLPAGRVIYILSQVAHALAEAHARGLIHRDIKPANIVLCDRGGAADMAKVVDFGLVKDLQSPGPNLSSTNLITGTPLYMAPETIESPDTIDARVDLYALGAVGYFLLTGKPLFEGRTAVEVCGQHLYSPPPRLSARDDVDVAADLEEVLLRCLAKDPADRFEDAMALRRALLSCVAATAWGLDLASEWWAQHGEAVRRQHAETRQPVGSRSGARLAPMAAPAKHAESVA